MVIAMSRPRTVAMKVFSILKDVRVASIRDLSRILNIKSKNLWSAIRTLEKYGIVERLDNNVIVLKKEVFVTVPIDGNKK